MIRAYLVITGAEDELRVGVEVEDTLDDFALVDGNGTNFEVLLANENYVFLSVI